MSSSAEPSGGDAYSSDMSLEEYAATRKELSFLAFLPQEEREAFAQEELQRIRQEKAKKDAEVKRAERIKAGQEQRLREAQLHLRETLDRRRLEMEHSRKRTRFEIVLFTSLMVALALSCGIFWLLGTLGWSLYPMMVFPVTLVLACPTFLVTRKLVGPGEPIRNLPTSTVKPVAPQEKPQRTSKRAQKQEEARRTQKRREAAQRRAEEVTHSYAQYLCDAVAVVRRPTLNDLGVPQTREFVQLYNDLQACGWESPEVDLAELERLVSQTEVAWQAAQQHATRIGCSDFSIEEQKRLRQAEQLLTLALSGGGTSHERKLAYERALVLLQGLVVLHEKAILELTSKAGLAIEARPAPLAPGTTATSAPERA